MMKMMNLNEVAIMEKEILQIGGYKAQLTNSYIYKDGKLFSVSATGIEMLLDSKPTRNAGKFKIFVHSFPNCAQPYSKYFIVNTETMNIYSLEVLHYLTGTLNEIVTLLKEM